MIAGFIAPAIVTLLVAWTVAVHELVQCRRQGRNPLLILDHRSLTRPLPYSPPAAAARKFLDALCDLQVITGTGIVVAGLANIRTISLYHSAFIADYWWLCLSSFWAGRPSYVLEDTAPGPLRVRLRRWTVLASVALASVFQGIVYHREDVEWNETDGKRCYVSHDKAADDVRWFWLAGVVLYGISLTFTLSRRLIGYVRASSDLQERALQVLWRRVANAFERRNISKSYATHPSSKAGKQKPTFGVLFYVQWFSAAISFLIFFIIVQFLAIFSYGTGLYALEAAVYTGFAAWNTYDILDRKISNRILLVPPQADGDLEMSWGFGQVLPLLLILALVYQAVDIFRGECHKRDL